MSERKLPLHIRMLQSELARRQEKNPRYSLRAFAMFLEIHPSALSRILSGKQDLSLDACVATIGKLNLGLDEVRLFVASVAEDKRNRATAILSRAIDPNLLSSVNFDPRSEHILNPQTQKSLDSNDVLALGDDFTSMMDLKGRFIFANEFIAKILDTIPCDLIGETWRGTSLDESTANLLVRQQEAVVEKQIPLSFDFSREVEGRNRHYTRLITPVFGSDGKMHAYVSTIRDVTWSHFVTNAMSAINSSIEYQQVVENIAKVCTPMLATAAVLEVKNENGYEIAAARHVAEEKDGEFRKFVASQASGLPPVKIPELTFNGEPVPKVALVADVGVQGQIVGRLSLFKDGRFGDTKIRAINQLSTIAAQAIINAKACS